MINKVIILCVRNDGKTFEIGARYIQRYISARKYIVIVPQSDLSYFSSLNLGSFYVISEEKYSHIAILLKQKQLGDRFGWYFQQFIKMSELDDGNCDDINVIWDADTIPLRKISFVIDGKIFFYQGAEHHKPYFKLIYNLLGTHKLLNTSFIAQCMPYRVSWFKNFVLEVEAQNNKCWYEKLIQLIDANEAAGFSEYETLGTYAVKNFRHEILINEKTNNWYRYGNSLICGPQNIENVSTKTQY